MKPEGVPTRSEWRGSSGRGAGVAREHDTRPAGTPLLEIMNYYGHRPLTTGETVVRRVCGPGTSSLPVRPEPTPTGRQGLQDRLWGSAGGKGRNLAVQTRPVPSTRTPETGPGTGVTDGGSDQGPVPYERLGRDPRAGAPSVPPREEPVLPGHRSSDTGEPECPDDRETGGARPTPVSSIQAPDTGTRLRADWGRRHRVETWTPTAVTTPEPGQVPRLVDRQ